MNDYPVDSEGKRIYVDDMVAYNKSGKVVRGRVANFKPRTDSIARNNKYNREVQWIVEIDYGGEKPSIVKDTDGILVI